MHKNKNLFGGFTLIELLLVIVLLGIIIVIALAVINPGKLQRRAYEAVLLSNASKICTAMYACASSSATNADCDSLAEIGANTPPAIGGLTATYNFNTAGTVTTMTASLPAASTSRVDSTACAVTCSFDSSAGTTVAASKSATNCY